MPRVLSSGAWTITGGGGVIGCTGDIDFKQSFEYGIASTNTEMSITSYGQYLYTLSQDFETPGSYTHTLYVHDMSNADSPALVGTTSLSWGTGPSTGGYFVGAGEYTLQIYDHYIIATGEFLNTGATPNDVYAVRWIDIQDPTAPLDLGGWNITDPTGNAVNAITSSVLFENGGKLYIGASVDLQLVTNARLYIIEAAPAAGILSASLLFSVANTPGLGYKNSRLYGVHSGSKTLSIVDVSTPTSPSLVSMTNFFTNTRNEACIVNGSTLWVVDFSLAVEHLIAVDISDLDAPSIVSQTLTDDARWRWQVCCDVLVMLNINVDTNLTTWDISNPSAPLKLNTVQISTDDGSETDPAGLKVECNRVYLLFLDYVTNTENLLTYSS